MYRLGDRVMYGVHGVCEIGDIVKQKVGTRMIEYYVLKPVDQSGSSYFVPTQNEAAVAKLRPVLTQEEIRALLCSEDIQQDSWIHDEQARKQCYSNLITSGDRASLIRMVHTLHKHKQQQAAAGRRLHLCDENFLRDAEKLLGSEFALVLNMEYQAVGNYVKTVLETDRKPDNISR